MTWTPQFQIIKTRAIADNLLAYIAANQADAILWANSSAALRPLKNIQNSVANRLAPVFPSIAFSSDEDQQTCDGDLIEGAYQVLFELYAESPDPNTASSEARVYAAAVKSMIRNCPPAAAGANTGAIDTVLHNIQAKFIEIETNDAKNDFFQKVQITATYTLYAATY